MVGPRASDLEKLKPWTKSYVRPTNAEGALCYYDEMADWDQAGELVNEPPEQEDMSDYWIPLVVKKYPKAGTRAEKWPAVFTMKGMTTKYSNKGQSSKVQQSDGLWYYRVVFGAVELRGWEGKNMSPLENRKKTTTNNFTIGRKAFIQADIWPLDDDQKEHVVRSDHGKIGTTFTALPIPPSMQKKSDASQKKRAASTTAKTPVAKKAKTKGGLNTDSAVVDDSAVVGEDELAIQSAGTTSQPGLKQENQAAPETSFFADAMHGLETKPTNQVDLNPFATPTSSMFGGGQRFDFGLSQDTKLSTIPKFQPSTIPQFQPTTLPTYGMPTTFGRTRIWNPTFSLDAPVKEEVQPDHVRMVSKLRAHTLTASSLVHILQKTEHVVRLLWDASRSRDQTKIDQARATAKATMETTGGLKQEAQLNLQVKYPQSAKRIFETEYRTVLTLPSQGLEEGDSVKDEFVKAEDSVGYGLYHG